MCRLLNISMQHTGYFTSHQNFRVKFWSHCYYLSRQCGHKYHCLHTVYTTLWSKSFYMWAASWLQISGHSILDSEEFGLKPSSNRTAAHAVIVHVLWTDAISQWVCIHGTFLVQLYCKLFTPHFTTGVWLSRVTHVSLMWVMSTIMHTVGEERHNTIVTLNTRWYSILCVILTIFCSLIPRPSPSFPLLAVWLSMYPRSFQKTRSTGASTHLLLSCQTYSWCLQKKHSISLHRLFR